MSEAASGAAQNLLIETISDAPIALPADPGLLTAEFLRAGDDLMIERPDGSHIVVEDYFAQAGAPDLVVGGAVVPGRMVAKLAQEQGGGAEAQADEAALQALGADPANADADAPEAAPGHSSGHAPAAVPTPLGEPIAEIASLEGVVTILRAGGGRLQVEAGAKLYEGDVIETGDGAGVGVEFIDGMTFSLGEEARMVLDEFAWAPDSHEGGGLFTILQGRFSFVSGEAAHTGEDALMIETPTMTIGVRGTKVVSEISADGETSRIALLPEENGRIGKIMVSTDGGAELISEPNRMVEVTSRFEAPSPQRPLSTSEVVAHFGEALSVLPAPAEFQQPEIAEAYSATHSGAETPGASEAALSFSTRPQNLREIAQSESRASVFQSTSDAGHGPRTSSLLDIAHDADAAAAFQPTAAPRPAQAGETAAASAAEEETLIETATIAPEPEAEPEPAPEPDPEPENTTAAPVFTSGETASAAESAAPGDTLYAAAATDADTAADDIVYSLIDDAGGLFTIDAATGAVSLADGRALDHETATSHQFTIRASDGVNQTDRTVTLAVTDENDNAPVFTSADTASAAESAAPGEVLYAAAATDADSTGEAIVYALIDDAGGLFTIDAATGAVSLADGRALDHETATSHQFTIRASDGVNQTDRTVTLAVTDANDSAPVFTSGAAATAAESAAPGEVLYAAAATDADSTGEAIVYSLIDDAGGLFTIDAATGAVSLADGRALDHETATSHQFTIRASDGANQTDRTVTLAVTDANDSAPVFTSGAAATAAESAAPGETLYAAAATDADSTGEAIVYSLIDDAGGLFTIDAATGAVSLADGRALDHETATSHQFTIRASDGVNQTDRTVTLAVTDENDNAPVFTSAAAFTIREGAPAGEVTHTAVATDADAAGALVYTLTDDAGGLFSIDAGTGVVSIAAGQSLDYETAASHQITIRVSDGVNAAEQTVAITVTDENDLGQTLTSAGSVTVADDAAPGEALYTAVAVDGDATGEAIYYTLADDAGGLFEINATTGVVSLASGRTLDHGSAASHEITIRSSDGTNSSDHAVTIAVTDATPELNISLGGGLDFSQGNYAVAVGDPGPLSNSLDPGLGNMTIEAWFYYDGHRDGMIVSKGNNDANETGYSIFIEDDTLVTRVNNGSGIAVFKVAASHVTLDASPGWRHVAMVIDNLSGRVTGYLDGDAADWDAGYDEVSDDVLGWYDIDSSADFLVGAADGNGSGYDNYGSIPVSDVRVWNVARSAADIAEDMGRTLEGDEPGLVLNLRLDDGAGLVAADNSGSGFDGTLTGAGGWMDVDAIVTQQDTILSGRLTATAEESGAVTFEIIDQADHGVAAIDADTGAWTYTPGSGYLGGDQISYQATDGAGHVETLTVTVSVV